MADETSKSSTAIIVIAIVAVVALVVGLLWLCGCLGQGTSAGKRGERVATILAVNDIYRIDGVGAEEIGGLHRLRTLRKDIEKKSGNVLLLHAGDFLSPSLESRVFKGEQMIDAMNNLDGDPNKFDARMFVAFGNHEFDDSNCLSAPASLNARIDESQFTWLNANLDFANCASMKDVMAHKERQAHGDCRTGRHQVRPVRYRPHPRYQEHEEIPELRRTLRIGARRDQGIARKKSGRGRRIDTP